MVSSKAEGRNLTFLGITFLPKDATVTLFHIEGNVAEFSRQLFPRLASREPPYENALSWLQFAYTRDSKGAYMATAKTDFSFTLSMEVGALLLPALECLWTLYPRAYTQGATAPTPPGPEGGEMVIGKRTHTGAAGVELFLGGGYPSPI